MVWVHALPTLTPRRGSRVETSGQRSPGGPSTFRHASMRHLRAGRCLPPWHRRRPRTPRAKLMQLGAAGHTPLLHGRQPSAAAAARSRHLLPLEIHWRTPAGPGTSRGRRGRPADALAQFPPAVPLGQRPGAPRLQTRSRRASRPCAPGVLRILGRSRLALHPLEVWSLGRPPQP